MPEPREGFDLDEADARDLNFIDLAPEMQDALAHFWNTSLDGSDHTWGTLTRAQRGTILSSATARPNGGTSTQGGGPTLNGAGSVTEPGRKADILRLAALAGSELDKLPAPEYLIDELLPKGVVAALYGPPGIGKSFLATDWDLSIAFGLSWQGRSVQKGRALYVAAEGSFGLAQRRRAWMHDKNIDQMDGDTWLPRTVNFLDQTWVAALVEFARDLDPLALIVLDTVARSMQGGDENSGKDMGLLIAGADALCEATGATVLLIHHTPRNGDNLRGHTSLEGAVDTAIWVKPIDGGFVLRCEKQKNAAKFEDIPLALIPTLDSCVVGTQVTSTYFQIDDDGRHMLEALQAADLGEGLSTTRWQVVSDVKASTFYRRRKSLIERGLVGSNGPERQQVFTLTDLGKDELTS